MSERLMKLDELRHELDTEARQRVAAQEETIKQLHNEVRQLRGLLKDRDEQIYRIMDGCYSATKGKKCISCSYLMNCNGGR